MVLSKDFNSGPFRWIVYNFNGSTLFISNSFYLPGAGQKYLIEMY